MAFMQSTVEMIQSHLIHMRAAGYSDNTVEDAEKILGIANRDLPFGLPTASSEELKSWLANPGWSANTRATYHKHLRRFFEWAADEDDPWIDFDPMRKIKPPKRPHGVPRPASDEQVRQAVTETAMPWRLHCVLAAYAGLRAIEIARLRREDVSENNVTVIRGKGGRDRVVPTHPRVWREVERLPPGVLTWRGSGLPPDADWVSMETGKYLRRQHIPITLYRLRHWYATTLLAKTDNLRVVQELMGHSTVATTEIYTQVTDKQRRAAIDLLPD